MTEYQLEKRPDGTDIHRFGDVTLAGMEQIERHENRRGVVVIGGDKGDVSADSVWRSEKNGEPAVVLCEAEFRTSLDVAPGDALDYLEEVVHFSYDSIQSETFLAHEDRQ